MFCLYSVLPALLFLPPILLDRINYDLKEEGPEFFGSSASFLSLAATIVAILSRQRTTQGFFYIAVCCVVRCLNRSSFQKFFLGAILNCNCTRIRKSASDGLFYFESNSLQLKCFVSVDGRKSKLKVGRGGTVGKALRATSRNFKRGFYLSSVRPSVSLFNSSPRPLFCEKNVCLSPPGEERRRGRRKREMQKRNWNVRPFFLNQTSHSGMGK